MKLEAWKNILDKKAQLGSDEEEDLFDNEPTEPEEGDIVITSAGPLGGRTEAYSYGKLIAEGVEWDDIKAQIEAWMKKENWYPSIWHISDHGNYSLTTLD